MADVACVFHWPLSELREMEPAELADWHGRAVKRAAPRRGRGAK